MADKTQNQPPFYVGMVVVSTDRKYILLGKRREDNLWTGPGGGANLHESPSQAAIREMFEECGIKISEHQLKELPSIVGMDGRMIFGFMVLLDRKTAKPHVKNDPDKEVPSWNWYKISDPLPGKTNESRMTMINAAKVKIMKLKKSEELAKALINKAFISNPEAGIDLDISKEAQTEKLVLDTDWLEILEREVAGLNYNDTPKEVGLPGFNVLYITKADDGIYSASVKHMDAFSGDYGDIQATFSKMTLTSLVEALRLKEYLPRETPKNSQELEITEEKEPVSGLDLVKPEISVEAEKQDLASVLSSLSNQGIHIHIHKSELLDALLKGKAFPVGTMRTWSNGVKAVKHVDGWVTVGGMHHGKLMGKWKEEATHKQAADEAENPAKPKEPYIPTTEQVDKLTQQLEQKRKERSAESRKKTNEAIEAADKAVEVERRKKEAAKLGGQQFVDGKPSAANAAVMKLLEGMDPEASSQILEAYSNAWHKANLSTPLPEEPEPKKSEEPKKPEPKPLSAEEALKAKLTKKPYMEMDEHGYGRIKLGDGSDSGYTIMPSSDKDQMKAIGDRNIQEIERRVQAYKMTQTEYLKLKKEENRGKRLGKNTKAQAIREHKKSVDEAIQAGLIKPTDRVVEPYIMLMQKHGVDVSDVISSNLPDDVDLSLQKKTNMIGTLNFKAAGAGVAKELTQNLNHANFLLSEMGLKFKTPINFKCTKAAKSTADLGASYSDSDKTITIRNKTRFNKTLMHEIGHAIDYAMQDQKTTPRGTQRSQGRTAELTGLSQFGSLVPEEQKQIAKAYQDLIDVVTGSEFYTTHVKTQKGRYGMQYYGEPTEIFARAFEVYSRVKAEEAVAQGKIDKSFLDSFVPDVFQRVNEDRKRIRAEYDATVRQFQTTADAMRSIERNFREEAIQKFPINSPEEAESQEMKRRNYVTDGVFENAEWKELRAKRDELHPQVSAKRQELEKEEYFKEVMPEKRAEYQSKIMEAMDIILKNDKIRKSILSSRLFALLKTI